MTWQRYLITPVNRDDLSKDMETLPYYSSKYRRHGNLSKYRHGHGNVTLLLR